MNVYEVRDASSDEQYYLLGIFLSLKSAKEKLWDLHSKNLRISGDEGFDNEYEKIEVYKIKADELEAPQIEGTLIFTVKRYCNVNGNWAWLEKERYVKSA